LEKFNFATKFERELQRRKDQEVTANLRTAPALEIIGI